MNALDLETREKIFLAREAENFPCLWRRCDPRFLNANANKAAYSSLGKLLNAEFTTNRFTRMFTFYP